MQEYGWYNIDNGVRGPRWFGVQFENPAGEPDPYPALGIRWDHTAMTAIPWHRLRVLASWNAHSGSAVPGATAATAATSFVDRTAPPGTAHRVPGTGYRVRGRDAAGNVPRTRRPGRDEPEEAATGPRHRRGRRGPPGAARCCRRPAWT